MLLSVIVPAYNTEKYLPRCLDSLVSQTLRDMEIICVDDGSTDDSLSVMQSYAKKDARIRIIQKENGGQVSARKAGVKAAKGRYIGYVDSDDWVSPVMYEALSGHAVRDRADLVTSGYFFEGHYTTVHYDGVPEGLYDAGRMGFLREHAIYNMKTGDVGIRASLCCKLFLAEKMKEAQLDIPEEVTMAEDKLCVLSYLLRCGRVSVRREAFYHYVSRPGSMVHTPDPGYLLKVHAVYQYFLGLYSHPLFTKDMRLQAELYVTELLYKGVNSLMGFENQNLLWIDPYWLREIPHGAKVALYGGGELGNAYKRQLAGRADFSLAGWVDFGWEKFAGSPFGISAPESLLHMEYDVVVITIKNQDKACEVKARLKEIGIPEKKIRWFGQKELYWKYAEANGWTRRSLE